MSFRAKVINFSLKSAPYYDFGMCTNFTPTQNSVWAKEHFDVDLPSHYPIETYPTYPAPIVLRNDKTQIACGLARFGLIPHWAKDETFGRHTYNARAETVADKPSYRTPWRKRQYCLVLVDNFFEPSYASGKAVRWEIKAANNEPMGIASIWDTWTDKESGELVVSFSMLTINADQNLVMQQFHKAGEEKRSPLVLRPEFFQEWLNATVDTAKSLMTVDAMPELVAVEHPKELSKAD